MTSRAPAQSAPEISCIEESKSIHDKRNLDRKMSRNQIPSSVQMMACIIVQSYDNDNEKQVMKEDKETNQFQRWERLADI